MKQNIEAASGVSVSPTLSDAIKEEENRIAANAGYDDSPITKEQPQTKFTGRFGIKILSNSKLSSEFIKGIKVGEVLLKGGGHDRVVWDRHYADQIKEAREKFYALLDQGYTAFEVRPDGSTGRQIMKFAPDLEEVIMVVPTRPG